MHIYVYINNIYLHIQTYLFIHIESEPASAMQAIDQKSPWKYTMEGEKISKA